MIINLKVKGLITASLLIGFGCFAEDSNSRAPEATAVEFEAQLTATTLAEATLAFSNLPSLEKAFIDAAPTDKKDGLVVGKLGVDVGNKELIVKFAQEIAEGHHGNFDSLLIAHEGKLMFESYYSRGRINLPHFQKSVTKVYISLAVGRAIQLGYLTMADLDQPLINFLKNIDPSKLVAGVEKITLHQAMTMRSGIRLSEEKREEINNNSSHLKGQRQVQAYLENSAAITAESQRFLYQNDPMLVMQVLDAVVSGSARDFIKKELIDKMGISNYGWETDVSGLPKSGSGSYMTSRDMVKWGLLTANKGKWNGEQLIPEAFINKAINRIVRDSDDENFTDDGLISNTGYGYFWWQADMEYRNKSYFSTSARGGGGQYIILFDELDLVIVVTAHDYDYRTLQIVAERILPAFVQDEFSGLKSTYFGQKTPGLTPQLFAPGVISLNGRFESAISFSPDLDELYFTASYEGEKTAIYFSKLDGDQWTPIKKANFTRGGKNEEMHPFVSPDGQRVYFTALDSSFSDEKIWYVNRSEGGWSDAIQLDSPLNDDLVFFANQGKNGGLYHFNLSKMQTYYAPNKNGQFPEAHEVKLELGHHAFIAPSEDYLLVTARNNENESRKDNDIYVYFKKQDGTWIKPINLGSTINSDFDEKGPSITPDGQYLFFSRSERDTEPGLGNIYWVSTEVINQLRPADLGK